MQVSKPKREAESSEKVQAVLARFINASTQAKDIDLEEEVLMSEAEYIDESEEEESPFLPGTNIQFAWDSTSLELIKRCPRLYYYKMIVGYTSNEEDVNLRFGAEFHQAMHDYQLLIADEIEHDEALYLTLKDLPTSYRRLEAGEQVEEQNIPSPVRDPVPR